MPIQQKCTRKAGYRWVKMWLISWYSRLSTACSVDILLRGQFEILLLHIQSVSLLMTLENSERLWALALMWGTRRGSRVLVLDWLTDTSVICGIVPADGKSLFFFSPYKSVFR